MYRYLLMTVLCLLAAAGGAAADEWVRETPGQKAYYDEDGNLTRVLLDTDGDKRFDAEETYAGRRVSRREDRDGDGVWERRFTWQKDGSVQLVEDRGKGSVQTTWFDARGTILKVEKDKDRDGSPETTWHYDHGVLQKVVKPRGVWLYREGQMVQAEFDSDRDGRIDRREYYSRGHMQRAEELTPSGKVRCLWAYDKEGKPSKAEEDADGDGRKEVTRIYGADGSITLSVDADGNGKPELRERYSPKGQLVSREEDLDGDGVFDLRTGRIKE